MNEASERIEQDVLDAPAADSAPDEVSPNGRAGSDANGDAGHTAGAEGASAAADGVTKEGVLDALKAVLDPELGINIVDLGLVYDVDIAEGHVHVTYTLTTMGCPIGPLVEAQMHQLLDPLPGIDSFDAEMVLRPPWSPEMMSEEAKEALGYF